MGTHRTIEMMLLLCLFVVAVLSEENFPAPQAQEKYVPQPQPAPHQAYPQQFVDPAQYVYPEAREDLEAPNPFVDPSVPNPYVDPAWQQHSGGQVFHDSCGQGLPIAHGPWLTVPNGRGVDPYGFGLSGGFGFDTQSLVTWGLGAVIFLLIISTVMQVFRRLLPSVKSPADEVSEEGGARSLETMGNLAQFALEAMDKYEKLNKEE